MWQFLKGINQHLVVAMALKARAIAGTPQLLVTIMVPLLMVYVANYLISTLASRFLLPRGDAIALVYGSVMRNLSMA